MIISRSPLRISLLGGGSDYPAWYKRNGGICVGGTIDKYVYIQARKLPPYQEFKTRVVYSAIEAVKDNLDIQHRVVNAVIQNYNKALREEGLEIFSAADCPSSSGLGTSSAFTVGLINALSTLNGVYEFPNELARKAIEIERVILQEAGGHQDQFFSSYGGFSAINFYPNEEINYQRLFLPEGRLQELESHLQLFYIKGKRLSGEIASSYNISEKSGWALVRMAEESVGVIRDGNWGKLAQLIDQSYRIKCGLSDKVSTNEISRLYNKGITYGSWGGKLCGAGGGGCLLFVTPLEKQQRVRKEMEADGLISIPFRFSNTGSQIIFSETTST